MSQLNHQDWQKIIAALGDLHSDFDPLTLSERTLTVTSKIIAAAGKVFRGRKTHDGRFA